MASNKKPAGTRTEKTGTHHCVPATLSCGSEIQVNGGVLEVSHTSPVVVTEIVIRI